MSQWSVDWLLMRWAIREDMVLPLSAEMGVAVRLQHSSVVAPLNEGIFEIYFV